MRVVPSGLFPFTSYAVRMNAHFRPPISFTSLSTAVIFPSVKSPLVKISFRPSPVISQVSPIFTGFGVIAGYALQGATWLIMKTQGRLQIWARRVAQRVMILVFVFIAAVSALTPWFSARIAERWFSWPNIAFFAPVPLVTLLLAGLLVRGADREREVLPFVCSVGLFFLSFSGLVISLWPMIAPPSVTLWQAAAAPDSHEFLMIGTAFVLPILLIYVVWSYWVFRGKASEGGYGHE